MPFKQHVGLLESWRALVHVFRLDLGEFGPRSPLVVWDPGVHYRNKLTSGSHSQEVWIVEFMDLEASGPGSPLDMGVLWTWECFGPASPILKKKLGPGRSYVRLFKNV